MKRMVDMKRYFFIAFIVILAIFLSACSTNKDSSLRLPNKTDVTAVSISCDEKKVKITDKEVIEKLFADLSTVRIKSDESYNDAPMAEKYIRISFEVFGRKTGDDTFIFEKGGKFFIEQPYHGIFSIEESQYSAISGMLP